MFPEDLALTDLVKAFLLSDLLVPAYEFYHEMAY
jgi:hypothetical protein